ncbi:MAG: sigma-70 family RNA polymerase sigma factor [Chitinophagia bacterium]|nr:sigma-70 family RNA polymerase sigma factor [Chitinophagia bacterium]
MTDHELLRLVSEGDQQSFTILFLRHWGRVFEASRRMLRSEHLAEEAVQEVFLRMWRKREGLRDVSSFDSYLFISVRNHVLNVLRRSCARMERLDMQYEGVPDDGMTVERQLQQKDLLSLLDEAVNGLPQQQRIAFRLAHQSGLGVNDIGMAMGISRNTVRNHLARALQSLRGQFRRR